METPLVSPPSDIAGAVDGRKTPAQDLSRAGQLTPPGVAPGAQRRRRRRRWPLVLVAVVVVAIVVVVMMQRSAAQKAALLAEKPEVVSVVRGRVEKMVESTGKIVSNLDVDIKCRASGEVVKLPFDISQHVKKGDVLCQLDPTDEQLAVRSAESTVTQSAARLAQAQDDLKQAIENLSTTRRKDEATLTSVTVRAANLRTKADRQKELIAQNLGSREEWETAETDSANAEADRIAAGIALDELKQQEIQIEYKREAVKVAEAQLQTDHLSLDVQRQQLVYTTVLAPIDGVVSSLGVQKGTIVASGVNGFSGGTAIMSLSDLSRIFLLATVDESDIGVVRVGDAARITAASFPDRSFTGKVVRIAAKGVNASNVVTFEVKVEVLDVHKDLLKPEMTGNVTIIQRQRSDVLTLPASAISRDGSKHFVTRVDGTRIPVMIGLEGVDVVEITAGLAVGDRVIVPKDEQPSKWKNQ